MTRGNTGLPYANTLNSYNTINLQYYICQQKQKKIIIFLYVKIRNGFIFCRHYRQLMVTYRAVDRLQAVVYDGDGRSVVCYVGVGNMANTNDVNIKAMLNAFLCIAMSIPSSSVGSMLTLAHMIKATLTVAMLV